MQRRIVVVGAGAGGALVCARLLPHLEAGSELTLVSRGPTPGQGLAYGTKDPDHLLNVRAEGMSAFPEEPGHFVEYLKSRGFTSDDFPGQEHRPAEALGKAFVPRALYAEYLGAVLDERAQVTEATYRFIQDETHAVRCHEGAYRVELGHHEAIDADYVVLAIGNLPPKTPPVLRDLPDDGRYLADPWSGHLSEIAPEEDVLLLGCSLTAIDVVMTLMRDTRTGKIRLRSRHGLLPRPHRLAPSTPSPAWELEEPTAKRLSKTIGGLAKAAGEEWRGAIDSLRPRTVELWQSLPWSERDRVFRRLSAYWDTHRHRIPEWVAARLDGFQTSGSIDIAAARLTSVTPTGNGFRVEAKRHDGTCETFHVDRIVNCTGSQTDYRAAAIPVLDAVTEAGLAEYDPLGFGLIVDAHGRTKENEGIFAIGPLCRGCRLETTAMPEIRRQAADISAAIMEGK